MNIILTDSQAWLLGLVMLMVTILWFYSICFIIPNRNATIKYLQDRNQTLEYWLNDMTADPGQRVPITGEALERRLKQVLVVKQSLEKQIERCSQDIQFFTNILHSKKITDEVK